MSKVLKKKNCERKSSSHERTGRDRSESSLPLLDATTGDQDTVWQQRLLHNMSDDTSSCQMEQAGVTEDDTESQEMKSEDDIGDQMNQKSNKVDLQPDVTKISEPVMDLSQPALGDVANSDASKLEDKSKKPNEASELCDKIKSSGSDRNMDLLCEKVAKPNQTADQSTDLKVNKIVDNSVDETDNLEFKTKETNSDAVSFSRVQDVAQQSDTESIYCDCKSEVSLNSLQGTSGVIPKHDLPQSEVEGTDTTVMGLEGLPDTSKSRRSLSGSSICTYALSTQSTMTDFCRICHCEGDAEIGPLIAPCFCRGSLRYVHQACLQQWIKSSDSKHCELCGYHFVMDSKLKPFHKWKKLSMSTTERRKIMCSVMFHIIAITCVIWSLQVLIDKTAGEIKAGKLEWPFWTKLVVVAIGFTGGLVFMYVQCKVYVQLWRRLKAFNRVIYVKNNTPVVAVASPDVDTVLDLPSEACVSENQVSSTEPNQNDSEGIVVVQMSCPPN